jgi:hypothetical protein
MWDLGFRNQEGKGKGSERGKDEMYGNCIYPSLSTYHSILSFTLIDIFNIQCQLQCKSISNNPLPI